MKVFISWSGERSHAIASALHDWLPSVIQTIETWISDADINKGARWAEKLAAGLEQTHVGIICLTPDNLNAPWLLFEAGSLSKIQQDTYVCTFLFELMPADIQGPLAQFQSTKADKEDIKKLIHTINTAQEKPILPKQVDTAFERGWKEFNERLEAVPNLQIDSKSTRSDSDMIKEILELVRTQARGNQSLPYLSPARLPSTVNWTPEDALLLSDFHQRILEGATVDAEREYAEEIRNNEKVALDVLKSIKAIRAGRQKRPNWGRVLSDYIEADKRDS